MAYLEELIGYSAALYLQIYGMKFEWNLHEPCVFVRDTERSEIRLQLIASFYSQLRDLQQHDNSGAIDF